MSSSRDNDKVKKRKGKEKEKKAGNSAIKPRNIRGNRKVLATVDGAGTPEDPQIYWLIPRPKKGIGERYEQIVRDAAQLAGMGVWYVRSLGHRTTAVGDMYVPDDLHVTVYVDQKTGGSPEETFEFDGHIYIASDDNGDPYRISHPEEFELVQTEAPVVLWDDNNNPIKHYPDDSYYDRYDYPEEDLPTEEWTQSEEWTQAQEWPQTQEWQELPQTQGAAQMESSASASKGKKKRKRKAKK